MTRAARPFARFYYDDFLAPAERGGHLDIYRDNDLYATWMRLLVASEKAWPLDPEIPRTERIKYVHLLRDKGLVELMPDNVRFQIKGFRVDREQRANSGRAGADVRWQSEGNALVLPTESEGISHRNASRGRAPAVLSLSGTDETDGETAVLVWLASVGATVAPDGNGYHRELVRFVERQGAPAVIAAMKSRHASGDRSARQLIYGAMNELEQIHRPTGAKAKGHQPDQSGIDDFLRPERPMLDLRKEPVR